MSDSYDKGMSKIKELFSQERYVYNIDINRILDDYNIGGNTSTIWNIIEDIADDNGFVKLMDNSGYSKSNIL
jgi:hypothetical protein